MNTHDAIRFVLAAGDRVVRAYVGDLSDQDLMVRPAPGANHIAWQLGHLVGGEHKGIEQLRPGAAPPLPAGFIETYGRGSSAKEDPGLYLTKDVYLDLYARHRAVLLELLGACSDAELGAPGPAAMRSYAPTVGMVFIVQGTHALMHAGQFAVVRRVLGKPVLF